MTRIASPLARFARPFAALCLVGVAVAPGCTSTDGSAPDLGACAIEGEGQFTYGEIGIGSCISGPVDLQFVERNGRTWLAVSNADPFRNFDGGSVLLLDWADAVGQFDSETVLTSDIESLTIDTEHFIGGLGWLQDDDKNVLLVTRRFSEDARTRSFEDSAYVFDLDAGAPWEGGAEIQLRDDPGAIAVAEDGTLYVLNYTDHSISVLDTTGGVILPIDLAPEAAILPAALDDLDLSGSVAEIDRVGLLDETRVPDDQWTLTWLPGQFRAWSSNGTGFDRWDSGGGPPVRTGIDGTIEPNVAAVEQVRDPFVVPIQIDAITSTTPFTVGASASFDLSMLYGSGGAIFAGSTVVVTSTDGLSTVWNWQSSPILNTGPTDSFDAIRSSPSMAIADGNIAIYYQAARDSAPGAGAIGLATSPDGLSYNSFDGPVVSPSGTDYTSYEDPFVQVDDRMNLSRMWLSMFDGNRYTIGYAESDNGISWSEPVEVVSSFTDMAAPVVRYVDGQYLMWATSRETTATEQWFHVLMRSHDGIVWSEPEYLFDAEQEFEPRDPPRLAVASEPASSWRVEGIDNGNNGLPAIAGFFYRDITHGYELTVASGHEFPNSRVFSDGLADLGVVPGSHYDFGGIDWLYVTHTGSDERPRISVLEGVNDDWDLRGLNLIPAGTGGNEAGVYSPVVREFAGGAFVMFYAAIDNNGISTIHAATSANGNTWFPAGPLFESSDALGEWAGAAQEPHSIELEENGTARIWLGGSNGSRFRIGAIENPNFDPSTPHLGWQLDPGEFTDYQLAPGVPGSVDDSGAKDPMVLTDDIGRTLMYYSAFDGANWHLAYAVQDGSGEWIRRADPATDETLPAMSRVPRTFSAAGVESPVARLRADGTFEVWYAGRDIAAQGVQRLGRGVAREEHVFPIQRVPTAGDTLTFETQRGDSVNGVIELAQNVEAFLTTGVGTTGLILDEERGMLYVPSKLSNLLYVVDIRDDTRVDFVDYNAMDLEALIRLPTVTGNNGYRGGVISESTDRLYLTTRNPESVLVLDLNAVEDDGVKDVTELPTVGSLPMQDTLQDAGVDSVAVIGGGHPAIATIPDGIGTDELLLVPHFRDNSLSVFDLGLGPYGAEIGYLPYLGENPHLVRVSPDGNWAVVANYLGDVDDQQSSSTLAVIDLNPASATYLQATNWIRNR